MKAVLKTLFMGVAFCAIAGGAIYLYDKCPERIAKQDKLIEAKVAQYIENNPSKSADIPHIIALQPVRPAPIPLASASAERVNESRNASENERIFELSLSAQHSSIKTSIAIFLFFPNDFFNMSFRKLLKRHTAPIVKSIAEPVYIQISDGI